MVLLIFLTGMEVSAKVSYTSDGLIMVLNFKKISIGRFSLIQKVINLIEIDQYVTKIDERKLNNVIEKMKQIMEIGMMLRNSF